MSLKSKYLFEPSIESDDQAVERCVRFWAKAGFLVAAIFTGISLKQLQAGENDLSEVSTTPQAYNCGQSRNTSGKFVKKGSLNRLKKIHESITGTNVKRKLYFAENPNENTCTSAKRITRTIEVAKCI